MQSYSIQERCVSNNTFIYISLSEDALNLGAEEPYFKSDFDAQICLLAGM